MARIALTSTSGDVVDGSKSTVALPIIRFTFASTPTFGFALTLVPLLLPAAAESVVDDCVLDAL